MASKTERVRLTEQQVKALETYSQKENMTKSDAIRKALALLIEKFPDQDMSQGKRTDIK